MSLAITTDSRHTWLLPFGISSPYTEATIVAIVYCCLYKYSYVPVVVDPVDEVAMEDSSRAPERMEAGKKNS